MKKIVLIISILLSITLTANEVKFYKPSFSCSNVKKESIEYKICSDKELSQLDTILSRTYQSFRLVTNEIKQEQKAWLKQRKKCKTKECIKESYLSRTEQLLISLKGQKTFPKHILDVMESVEKNKLGYLKDINLVIVPITPKDNGFKNDLFHFRNFTFIKPIKSNLSYDSEELKKYLGECWKYELYKRLYTERDVVLKNGKSVGKYSYFAYMGKDKYNYKELTSYQIYKPIKIDDKEYYFVKGDILNLGNEFLLLFDKKNCNSFGKKHNFDIVAALNADVLRTNVEGMSKFYLVKYKNQLAVLNIFGEGQRVAKFRLYKLLGNDGRANKNLFVYKPISIAQFENKNDISYKSTIKEIEQAKKLKNKQRNK